MRPFAPIAAIALLGACGSREADTAAPPNALSEASPAPAAGMPASSAVAARWELQATGKGSALTLLSPDGGAALRLFCPARESRLLVSVPGFRPVASEERLSFGGGGEAVALVADPRGDAQRGGVSGAGDVPRNLAALLAGPLSASYGAQASGPHPTPPADLAQPFVAACYKRLAVPAQPTAAAPASPCLVQGGEQLRVAPLRAVGTEPFWGARIEGRCVTYSHPDNIQGTRIWARYTAGPNGAGSWVGALAGRPFELRTRPAPGCSDGMSDRRYPIAVDLLINGERRTGCAEPI